jgi:diacylglycerol kinase (ATP)
MGAAPPTRMEAMQTWTLGRRKTDINCQVGEEASILQDVRPHELRRKPSRDKALRIPFRLRPVPKTGADTQLERNGQLNLSTAAGPVMDADSVVTNRYKRRGAVRLLRALAASWRGLRAAYREEAAFRQELALALIVIPLACWLGRNGVERALLVAPMLLTLIVELINSAIEATLDRIGFERHVLAGFAKDVGSAAVFVSFLLLGAVWLLVLSGR